MKKVTAMLAALFIVSSFSFTLEMNEFSTSKKNNHFTEDASEIQTKGRGETGYS